MQPLKLNFKFGFFLLSGFIIPRNYYNVSNVHCQNFIASVIISSIFLSPIICVFIQCRLQLLLLIFSYLPCVLLLVLLCCHQSNTAKPSHTMSLLILSAFVQKVSQTLPNLPFMSTPFFFFCWGCNTVFFLILFST